MEDTITEEVKLRPYIWSIKLTRVIPPNVMKTGQITWQASCVPKSVTDYLKLRKKTQVCIRITYGPTL